ncbi:sensor histidine kinase [Yinghuangia seranimata]|uniref:sensor histidine kinase n=1 Tax=Yinghuangia seranimata TaxID=408067 RepID=UPI00248B93BC|nr:sensor histidine kinase [Yinghuangia seranimata]MDI2126968.1 sensor histidine kinase [Yinghuangia seranimata]
MSTAGTTVPDAERRARVPRPGFWRAPISARTWGETIHLTLNLFVGTVGFIFVVVLVTLGVGLTPLFLVGLPMLAGTVISCRGWGAMERARARALMGEDTLAPAPFKQKSSGAWGWIKSGLGDGPGWRAALYLFLMLPWGIFTFTMAVTLWAVTLSLIAYPALQPLYRMADQPGAMLWGDGPKQPGDDFYVAGPLWVTVTVLIGVVMLFLTPQLIRGLAWVDRVMVRALLGTAFLSQQVQELTESRGAALDTGAADLRRIERDLHDGAQARLVSLAMDLGLAKEKMNEDPESAQRMVSEAHNEVKLALRELRDLARGIHPAVLTDRGLDAALSAVAAKCTVPVQVTVDLPLRPSAPVETAAYYCVSELLTNVSKHSGATSAKVTVSARGKQLYAVVEDNGRGGADPAHGTGLAGLGERVRGVGGALHVDSPVGGPTRATVTLPL